MELRDLLLTQAAQLIQDGISLPSLVKMVLEVDRHAMAAEMMLLKVKAGETPNEWSAYQKYLSGEITLEEYLRNKPGLDVKMRPAPEAPDEEVPVPTKRRK